MGRYAHIPFEVLSAYADGELSPVESGAVLQHVGGCPDCSRQLSTFGRLDHELAGAAALGCGSVRELLSAELDGELAGDESVVLAMHLLRCSDCNAVRVSWSTLDTALAMLPGGMPSARVDAADTHAQVALIRVGGRPSALALNQTANTILVLDATRKIVTEIDGSSNQVTATAQIPVTGTPTSIQVDPSSGKVVVSAVATPAPSAAGTASGGSVVVLNGSDLKLQATSTVPVAPRLVVLDPSGARALLVSSDLTTIVDGVTYRELAQLPGGVAGAFSEDGSAAAVLSASGTGTRVTISTDRLRTLDLSGTPLTIIAVDGGFAALVKVDGGGRIVELSADGAVRATADVPLSGRDLSYDPRTRRYAIASAGGVAYSTSAPVAAASPQPSSAAPSPTNASVPSPAASATPQPSSAPSPSPVPVATQPPVAVVPVPQPSRNDDAPRNLLAGATLAWPGTYHFDLVNTPRPVLLGNGGDRLWFVNEANGIDSLDPATGRVFAIAQLPADARIRSLEVGAHHVYAIDGAIGRVYIISLPSEKLTTLTLPFLKASPGAAVTPDDRLWVAIAGSGQVVTVDPTTGAIEAANIGIYEVSALTTDVSGRVWVADESRKSVNLYDPAHHLVTEYRVGWTGAVNAMAADGRGTLWIGTSKGELLGVRAGAQVSRRDVGGIVETLAMAPDGSVWYGTGGAQVRYGPAEGSAFSTGPGSMSGLWIDATGRVWLADGTSSAFYITQREGK